MGDIMLRVRLSPEATGKADEVVVDDLMTHLEKRKPGVIEGYTWERQDEHHLILWMWGERIDRELSP